MLHPHVGTMIENTAEVQRVLDGSSIELCLDTGHLLIGGTDPAELTRQAPERVAHVHFKDVDASKAKHVQDGRWTYTEGVTRGMYRPLGTGDVDVAAIVEHLTKRGYDGWYTLEQDTILEDKPTGEGPVARRPDQRGQPARRAAEARDDAAAATEPLRVGILGAARIAQLAIVKPAHATGTRLVTVAARDRQRAEAFAAEHGVERATRLLRRGRWPTPRSRSSTTRCRTRSTGRGTSPPSRRASTCCRRSRSPPPRRRRRRCAPPRRSRASRWWRASTTCSTR